MLMFLLFPPAAQTAVMPPRAGGAMVEALGGIAEAYVAGKEAEIPALIAIARRQWEHSRLKHAPVLAEQDLQFIDRSLEGLPGLKPRFQAESALAMAAILGARMRPSPAKECMDADQATMLAWCRVEARCWDKLPNVAEAFRPLLERNATRRAAETAQIRAYLEQLQDDVGRKSVSGAKKDLRRLLDLIDVIEKP